jgi:Flp pilus assembly protein TadB
MEERRRQQQDLVPGSGFAATMDRGAWSALSQGPPGTWSWRRALGTIAVTMAVAALLVAFVYPEPTVLVGLAIAYGLILWRARRVHLAYLERTGRAPR